MKRIIRLTENDLHRIVKNAVKRIMKEDIGATNTLPNGLPDDLSDEQYIQAWDNMWTNWLMDNEARRGLNIPLYRKYRGQPDKIKNWFIRFGGKNSNFGNGTILDPHDFL